jgi:hypothetical protein
VDDLDFECVETATYLTYRASKKLIENLTYAKVSRGQIFNYVQKIWEFMKQERQKTENSTENPTEKEENLEIDLIFGHVSNQFIPKFQHIYDQTKNNSMHIPRLRITNRHTSQTLQSRTKRQMLTPNTLRIPLTRT